MQIKGYILAILALLTIMFALVYFCEPSMACQGHNGKGDHAGQQGKSSDAKSSGDVQSDNDHEGNGGEPVYLIDCDNPVFFDCTPCRRLNR